MSGVKPRPAIESLIRYQPSRAPAYEGRIIHLSANEGALGPSEKAVAAMADYARESHRYPPIETSGLTEVIAEKHGLDPERIILGCGSDELIANLITAYVDPGDEVIHTQYGFLMFPFATKVAGGVPVSAPDDEYTVSIDAILECVTDKTKLIFLANPNNPTGTYLPHSEIERLHQNLPGHIMLVLDAAYAEYVQRNDYSPGHDLVERADNVVMLRTFSKMYAMAGLRLGWGYVPKAVRDTILSIKPPYSVNYPAIVAGIASLQDAEFQSRTIAHNDTWMAWTQEQLRKLGLECLPTVCNFFMLRFPDEPKLNAAAAKACLAEHGIMVREMESYGAPEFVRMSIGTEDEMRKVVAVIAEFLKNGGSS